MTAARTVYDEVREQPAGWWRTAARWRLRRDKWEQAIIDGRTGARTVREPDRILLLRIAALAIAQIEALDRRTEGAK